MLSLISGCSPIYSNCVRPLAVQMIRSSPTETNFSLIMIWGIYYEVLVTNVVNLV